MTTGTALRRTPLHDQHVEAGGRLVDFHGWELPVQYQGIIREHGAVRSACGMFDVSHMGQVWARGKQARAFLQKINSNDISRLSPGKGVYSHLPNEKGGVVDDVIVSCLAEDRFLIVVNAATSDKDFRWMSKHAKGMAVELENASDLYGMIALQGPRAVEVAESLGYAQAAALPRFGAMEVSIFDQPSVITRTGYTGEDGFEFIVPAEVICRLWENLMTKGRSVGLEPCGLGARDTLRLEAGLLLYGQDLDDDHSPLEAGYGWVVKFQKGDFIGKEALEKQKQEGLRRRMTGLRLTERGVPRPGCAVLQDGRKLGTLASGTFSTTLQAGIGMGYLDRPDLKSGTLLQVELHGRAVGAEVVPMPF